MQRIVNWIFDKLFIPTVTYIKKFPEAIDPDSVEGGYVLRSPFPIRLEPGERYLANTGLVFQFPGYLAMSIWKEQQQQQQPGSEHLIVHAGQVERGDCVWVVLENRHPNETLDIPRRAPLVRATFQMTVVPRLKTPTTHF